MRKYQMMYAISRKLVDLCTFESEIQKGAEIMPITKVEVNCKLLY